jgi:transcriptional regulator NrdR family protein
MKCPECGTRGKCFNTRQKKDDWRWRRYECARGHRFSTTEVTSNNFESINNELIELRLFKSQIIEKVRTM